MNLNDDEYVENDDDIDSLYDDDDGDDVNEGDDIKPNDTPPVDDTPPVNEDPIPNPEDNDSNPDDDSHKEIDYDELDEKARKEKEEDGFKPEDVDIDENLTPMELILSQYDIEGGMIALDDGSEVNIKDLKPSKQVEVLNQLREQEVAGMRKEIVDEFGLSPEEINIINLGREEGSSIQSVIDNLAAQRAETLLTQRDSVSTDYDNMEDKAIYLKYLRDNNPQATGEEIEAKLNEAAEFSAFADIVKPLREGYKNIQNKELEKERAQFQQEEYESLEADRTKIVQSAQDITDILGIPLNNDDKNEVLEELLEVNDEGDSLFMERVFSDPAKLFKVAWLEKYGEKMSQDKDAYWKKKVSAAYTKGRNEVLKGLPSTSVNARGKSQDSNIAQPNRKIKKYKTQDDLFDEDE